MLIREDALAEFVTASRRVAEYRMLQCSSGNLSCRYDGELALVTATRSWLGDLTTKEVSLVKISDGTIVNGPKPSVENRFHLGILKQRSEVNVVLHFQSPAATTLSCCTHLESINFFVVPEIPFYIGPIAIVPYIDPGSAELADAVVDAMAKHNLAVLTNHGLVTVGKTQNEALQRAVFFELACDIIVRGGDKVRPLDHGAAERLLAPAAKV